MDYIFDDIIRKIPSTRYQGSKRKLLPWIFSKIKDLEFETILDAFGGSASVSLLLKRMGKKVTYNDILKFNSIIGDSVIANPGYILLDSDIDFLLDLSYNNINGFIYNTFKGIYYTDEENIWLDNVILKIKDLDIFYNGEELRFKQAIAYNALFQSCMIKRPYNLFHRKNLEIRMRQVERNFGNKKTWDTPFEEHFRKFVKEINNATFDSGVKCSSTNCDVMNINSVYDAVYIDPPYIKKTGTVDYMDYYHFLEGIVDYESWNDRIDLETRNKKIIPNYQNIYKPCYATETFDNLFSKYKESKLIVSYKDNGLPSIDDLIELIKRYKENVRVYKTEYKYALNKNNKDGYEYLIIGE